MKRAIENYLSRNVSSMYETKVLGTDSHYQVFIEAGACINMKCFRMAVERAVDEEIYIDVTCVMDADDSEYKLLIEIYW